MVIKYTLSNGKKFDFNFSDAFIPYYKLRNSFTSELSLKIIKDVKSFLNKKCAIVFGNCQTIRIISYLTYNVGFLKKYFLITLPAVFSYNDNIIDIIDENFWEICDLFITQYIKEDNEYSSRLSTKSLIKKLNSNVKIVIIPNLYFTGYHVQYKKNDYNIDTNLHQSGRFPYGDTFIDSFLEKNNKDYEFINKYKIINDICNIDFLEKNTILKNINDSLEEFTKRESICDVHIIDYIKENFCYEQLFFSPNHPSNVLLVELTNRILNYIGIDRTIYINMYKILNPYDLNFSLIGQGLPIYTSVINTINLKYFFEVAYPNLYLWNFSGNLQKYSAGYIYYCHLLDRKI